VDLSVGHQPFEIFEHHAVHEDVAETTPTERTIRILFRLSQNSRKLRILNRFSQGNDVRLFGLQFSLPYDKRERQDEESGWNNRSKGMMLYYVYVGPDVSPADAHVSDRRFGARKSEDLLDEFGGIGV
jgi:hypothetical protein